jgi:UDP-D-galactose:(glucosyl)LPS alpha-1,6-D-galactosyltransferase
LKTLFIFTGFLGTQGGGERVLNTISKYLMSTGNEIRFLVVPMVNTDIELSKEPSEWVEPFKSNKDKTFLMKIRNVQGIPYPTEYKKIVSFFEKEFKPNVVLVTSPFLPKLVKKAIKKSGFDSKVIGWYHGSLFANKILRRTIKNIMIKIEFKAVDAHLAISTGIRDQILKLNPTAKVYTVFNPLEPYEGDLVSRSKTPIFIYVGRIYDGPKNISFMFEGLSKIKQNWKLIIVGTGSDESKLKTLADSLGISKRIEWRGFKKNPYENLDEGITALLLTSRYEGFGMVLIEANQRGIPAISSNCQTGPSDIIINGKNGYLYPEGDMDAFVKIINDVIDGKLGFGTSEEIAKTANRFSTNEVCGNIKNVLQEIISSRNC